MKRTLFPIALVIAFLLQLGLIGIMLVDRYSIIQNGKEVVLQSRFVDPRDLFRGHYVRLNLTAGTIGENLPGATDKLVYNKPVYVALKKGENGFWVAKALYLTLPENHEDPILQGEYRGKRGNTLNIRFPFDRYFAPKLRAQELEKLRNQEKLGIVVAVNEEGNGVIKGVSIEGKVIYDEPLL